MELVCGIGVNDADYTVKPLIDGKRVICPFYKTWHNVLKRVSDEVRKESDSSYIGTTICDDWKYFSKFKAWMETQHWRGLQLDKDLVLRGNKEYGPENCVFVPSFVNTALHAKQEGLYPLGVAMWNDQRKKCFVSQCSSKLKRSSKYLGYFSTVDEAHRAWQKAKIEGLNLIIDQYSLM